MSNKKTNCTCIQDMEQKILDFYKEKGNLINPSEAKWDNAHFIMSEGNNGPGYQPYLPVTILSETKNGKPKKTKISIGLSYCPICGQDWRKKKDDE